VGEEDGARPVAAHERPLLAEVRRVRRDRRQIAALASAAGAQEPVDPAAARQSVQSSRILKAAVIFSGNDPDSRS